VGVRKRSKGMFTRKTPLKYKEGGETGPKVRYQQMKGERTSILSHTHGEGIRRGCPRDECLLFQGRRIRVWRRRGNLKGRSGRASLK